MAQSRQALGKGIGALIPSAGSRRGVATPRPSAPREESPPKIPLDLVDLNPRQPRVHFDEVALEELATSIAERGVLQPILVRPRPNGRYELIAGERRLRASQRAGLTHIPALVKPMSDDESLLVALIENVQRADLDPIEEAKGYQALMSEFGLTQEEIAKRVGKSRPAIANALRLLQLPAETQAEIRSGRLSAGHARALLGLEDPGARQDLARQILDAGLSVRDTERAVQDARKRSAAAPARTDPDLARMESDLSRALGTKVTIATSRASAGRGRVEIHFYSNEDLARLADLLQQATHTGRSRAARA